jgi:hypothetical protein
VRQAVEGLNNRQITDENPCLHKPTIGSLVIQEGEQPFSMLADLHKKYNWVLETRSYDSIDTLMKALKPGIIDPAIKMHYELRLIKAKE